MRKQGRCFARQGTAALLIAVPFLSGCSTVRPPTASDQIAILAALVEYEKSNNDPEPIEISPELRFKKDAVYARYTRCSSTTQIAFTPMIAKLKREEGTWTVVSAKANWPWWWHVVNHTVGVK